MRNLRLDEGGLVRVDKVGFFFSVSELMVMWRRLEKGTQ